MNEGLCLACQGITDTCPMKVWAGDPRKRLTRVWLNGEEITNECHCTDGKSKAHVWAKNSRGKRYVCPRCKEEPASAILTGTIHMRSGVSERGKG